MEKVLLKLYAEWCGPCKMMNPIVEQFAAQTGIKVQEVNVEDEPEVAQKYNVSSVPTFVKLVDGKAVDMASGFMGLPKLKEFMD